jgi:phosphoribosyl-ATP pyrophosphohydrolase
VELVELEAVLQERKGADPGQSYTAKLLGDPELIQRKIMEEAFEVCLELGRDGAKADSRRTAEEAADLMYHLLVGLVGAGVSLDEVMAVLEERRS